MKKLDRFILREVIADGPRGTVYRADEVLPGDNRRAVAVKVWPEIGGGAVTGESAEEQRFFAEVRALAKLPVHPNLVTIHAMGLTDGRPWMAMELTAATLDARMGEGPAEWREVLAMMEQVGRGLSAMHGLKPALVHQDLKPANILVDRGGGAWNYKVTDFSGGATAAANKTQAVATVRYAAPELLSGEHGAVGPATDLYALGHIAYEMALGRKLHRQQFPAVFEGNSGKEPPPNKWMMWHASMGLRPAAVESVVKGFPRELSEIIEKLMKKALAERYGSAEALLADLARVGGGGVEGAGMQEAAEVLPAARAPAAREARRGNASAGAEAREAPGRYWVRLRGKVSGPFDLATLQRQVKQGQLSRLHQVSSDQVSWTSASAIEGLFGPTMV